MVRPPSRWFCPAVPRCPVVPSCEPGCHSARQQATGPQVGRFPSCHLPRRPRSPLVLFAHSPLFWFGIECVCTPSCVCRRQCAANAATEMNAAPPTILIRDMVKEKKPTDGRPLLGASHPSAFLSRLSRLASLLSLSLSLLGCRCCWPAASPSRALLPPLLLLLLFPPPADRSLHGLRWENHCRVRSHGITKGGWPRQRLHLGWAGHNSTPYAYCSEAPHGPLTTRTKETAQTQTLAGVEDR